MVIRKKLNIKGKAAVFITTTVYEWKKILIIPEVSDIITEELEKTCKLYEVSIISYVVMPSHFHAIFGFIQIEKLSQFMQCFKSITSRRVKDLKLTELKENKFKLWKPRYDDLIIYSEKQLKIKMEYIHNNPVKSDLVSMPADWKLSSASDWLMDVNGVLKIEKDWII